jgi:2-polyprenyl-3-methyl-5-hydroxy-6-metoxy-1,4-benzoquinol methylase
MELFAHDTPCELNINEHEASLASSSRMELPRISRGDSRLSAELHQTIEAQQIETASEKGMMRLSPQPLSWRQITKSPVHDFPIRDEILFQYAPSLNGLKILEIGPGSGFTAFRLAPTVERLTLVDFAKTTIADLQKQFCGNENIRLIQSDVCQMNFAVQVGQDHDFVFALDMFEYVPDESAALMNLASVIRPQGSAFLSFPNFAPPRGDGATWYAHRHTLEESLRRAGFQRWEVFTVRLKPYQSLIYTVMHEWPLKLYRRLRRKEGAQLPQTYEATWAFQNRKRFERIKPLIHLYWALMSLLLRLGGDPFRSEPAPEEILSRQLVVIGWK